jgi:aminoglycoside 3-N-acetyltransferase
MTTVRARLRTVASRVLPPAVEWGLKRLVRAYHQRFFAYTPADLTSALGDLGVVPGDVLMVHSAFDRFRGFHGGPVDVVRALQEAVGPGGTLMMPTFPFRGTALEYARSEPVFDAQHTVSRMGLITEVFRRAPGVVRSLHPTHSVAAWGSRAAAIIAGHELAETPCGRLTPYGRLLDYDGKILLAGVPPSTMTFCYFVAEELQPRLPVPVLTQERYPMRWKDGDGTVRVSQLRLFAPGIDHDLHPLFSELKRRNQWHERSVGRLRLILVRAREVYEAAGALADRGLFIRRRVG